MMEESDDDVSSSSGRERNEQSRENSDKPLVTEPSELDVLLGRGKSNKNWPGKEFE
jgi:hypothetical protein